MQDDESSVPLARAMDMIFTLLVLYTLAQWSSVSISVPSIIVYLFTCLVVINDWFSFRATAELYSIGMFSVDILVVFVLANILSPLKQGTALGYLPQYWIYFAMLTAVYAAWDLILARLEKTPLDRKKGLRKWAATMALNSLLSIGTFMIQTYYLNNQLFFDNVGILANWIALLPGGLYSFALIYWNKEKLDWLRKQFSH